MLANDLNSVRSLDEMDWLIGTWRTDGVLGPDDSDLGPPGTPCSTIYTWRRANKSFIVEEVNFEANKKIRKHMTAMIGLDHATKGIAMWTFRYDGVHGRSDVLSAGSVIQLNFKGMSEKGPVTTVIVWKRIDDDTFSRQFTKRTVGNQPLPDSPISTVKRQ